MEDCLTKQEFPCVNPTETGHSNIHLQNIVHFIRNQIPLPSQTDGTFRPTPSPNKRSSHATKSKTVPLLNEA